MLADLLLLGLIGCQPAAVDDPVTDTGAATGTPPTEDGGTDLTDGGTDGGTGSTDGGSSDGGTELPEIEQLVYINEFMAENDRAHPDESGAYPDWIELYNAGEVDVDLTGWTITDDLDESERHAIGALTLPAGGTLVLYADGSAESGPRHLPFSLNATGEALGLYDAEGRAVDLLTFDAQLGDVSATRSWDGSATWTMGWPSTPGASNGAGLPEPDPAAAIEHVPAAAWDDSPLFSEDELPAFELELPPASIAALVASPYEYVEGTLIYDGVRYGPIGIRTKGENSWQPITEKPSLKLKMDQFEDGPGHLLGLTEITLQNMDNDYSMMHERVAYRLYREAGVPAARATHATLTLNGEDYGLYTHLETVNQQMIARWFEDADGSLFEQWDVDFYSYYIDAFELEFGEDDRTNLAGLAEAMLVPEAAMAIAAGADHLSWESFQLYWAVGAVVGQFDAYPYSSPGDDCHVYDDPTSGVLHYIPHGMDEAFYYPTHNVESNAIGILAATCRNDADCRDAWVDRIDDALDVADDIALHDYAAGVAEQIVPLVEADLNKPYSTPDVLAYQASMLDFIEQRRGELAGQVGSTP